MRLEPSIVWTIDAGKRLVRLRYLRDPTLDEMTSIIVAVFGDAEFRPGFNILADRSSITTPPSTEYVHRMVAFMGQYRAQLAGSRWAHVVPAGASYGMARMGGMVGAENLMQYEVFTDVAEAERWLSANPSTLANP